LYTENTAHKHKEKELRCKIWGT